MCGVGVCGCVWCVFVYAHMHVCASDSRLREPGFESCAGTANLFDTAVFLFIFLHFTLNEYLVIYIRGYLCTNSLRTLIATWLDASQRSRGGVRLNRSAREYNVQC